ncbi:MAG: helix-turn-helix domain-containing protein [Geminicoccaceae bacterium]
MSAKLRALIADAAERALQRDGQHLTLPIWMSPRDAAQYLSCTTQHLQNLRARRTGPPFVRFGRLVRYARVDLDAYLSIRKVNTKLSNADQ